MAPLNKASPLDMAIKDQDRKTLDMVRDSLRRGDAILAFQPVVLASDQSRVAFYEGLIRVRDETGRIIPAKEFIHVAESDEIGRMIDSLSVKLGLAALSAAPGIRLSLNMSARSIGYAAWNNALQEGIDSDPTVAERLILEISEESINVMPDVVAAFMDDMQIKGVSFAIDDFGAGYTALTNLRDYFFDAVKIDGSFIDGIATNIDNQALVRALIAVALNFEMFTVAEKVSNESDAAFLADIGIDCLQGYHFGVPTIREPWAPEGEAKRA